MKYFTKLFLPLFLTCDFASASDQLILIESDDFNTTHAVLTRYEKQKNSYRQVGIQLPVNLGRNGLAWGLGQSG